MMICGTSLSWYRGKGDKWNESFDLTVKHSMIRLLLTSLLLIVFAKDLSASGWNDYSADIGHGFNIYRMNSFQVCIGGSDSTLLICPSEGDEFGPVVNYVFTESHLLVETLGVMPHPKNSRMQTGNPNQQYYFLIDKITHEVVGPLGSDQFNSNAAVHRKLDWKNPSNPNILRPLLGNLMFLSITVLFFGWPLILVLLIFLVIRHIRKRRRIIEANNA